MNGKNIMHPTQRYLEGKDLIEFQDKKGTFLLKEMTKILSKKKQSFYDWYWIKANDKSKEQYLKRGLFKKFEPLNFFVGLGIYVDIFEKKQKQEILNYVSNQKLIEDRYVFILDHKGNMLAYPHKEYVNKNFLKFTSSNNQSAAKEILNLVETKNEGFIQYNLPTILDKKDEKKISYVKYFDKWKWTIASGFLLSDFDRKLKIKEKELENSKNNYESIVFTTLFLVAIGVVLISFYTSKLIEKRFHKYKKIILNNKNKQIEKDRILSQKLKMASLGEMLHNIAHQWKQPLSGISTTSSTLSLKCEMGTLEKDEVKESADTILNLTNYLSNTLENFRNFFKPTSDKKFFNIKETLNKSVQILESDLVSSSVHLKINCDNEKVYGFENDIMQIFLNLINNAKDAFLDKNDTKEKYIFVDIYKKEEFVIVKIKDNAGGIKKDNMQRIFEPYFTTKHQYHGTGIGLYMVKEILEKHMNSTIEVKNVKFEYNLEEHYGAEFEFKLKTTEY